MADLQLLRTFARGLNFNLTGTLSHETHVTALAERWLPIIRFHEEERFHPVGTDGLALIPRAVFRGLAPAAQAGLEVEVRVPDIGGTTVIRRFPPPVLRTPSEEGEGQIVHNETDDTLRPFGILEVGKDTVLTHGASFEASNSIFGSLLTVNGLGEPEPGDPRSPRHEIKVMAEFRMVLESLHYMLEVNAAADDEHPKDDDSSWVPAPLRSLFFQPHTPDPPLFFEGDAKAILLDVFRGEVNNDPDLQEAALARVPGGWAFRNDVFETARNAALLEYQFTYAYNDYNRYEPWPANFHEGDDEGCCLVFDRRSLERAAEAGDVTAFLRVAPLFVITSVHLARQSADRIKDFDPLSRNEVFVALGSHATYLTPGSHDFLTRGEAFEEGLNLLPWWVAALSIGAIPLLLGLLTMIGEHFRDANDETSESGVAGVSPDQPPPDVVAPERIFNVMLEVTPLSSDDNIFASASPPTADEDGRLGLLSFAGQLGAHRGSLGNESPFYERKFSRFFRKLIQSGRRIGAGA